ncbi:hypothetical protein K439DRAFT_1624028 [Ramaria rubella]|nr:hypothetical protein K439DRAFT_1624028 [Ramaria rubella]
MYATITVVWIVLDMAGQVSLLVLLATYFFCKDLPGRNNPYLLNFLFTTFLATFPPCLLPQDLSFYTGQQEAPAHWICVMQSILMDGIAPMFEFALLILAFQTWAGIRAIMCKKTRRRATSSVAKWIQAVQPSSVYSLGVYLYCINTSENPPIRELIRPFLIICGILEIVFEVWIAVLIIPRSGRAQIYARLCIFTILQLGPVL